MKNDTQSKKRLVRIALPAAVVIAASAGLLAFRSADNGPERPSLARYNPAAVAAVGEDIPENDGEVAVVMEVRNVCQQVNAYATGEGSLKDITASIDGSTREALAVGERVGQPVDITEFSDFAKSQIEASEEAGSTDAARAFVEGECSGTDFTIPVLAKG